MGTVKRRENSKNGGSNHKIGLCVAVVILAFLVLLVVSLVVAVSVSLGLFAFLAVQLSHLEELA